MGDQDKSEDLFREYLNRSKSGEDVDPEEYIHNYPDLAEDLKKLFAKLEKKKGREVDLAKSGSDKLPNTIGDFKIIQQIGKGGMGTVFEAEQISLNRKVALKVLPSHMSFSDDAVKKFKREAEAGGRQSHPGIVAIYAFGEVEGIHYIAQELIVGGLTLKDSLDQFRKDQDQPQGYFRETAMLISEVADALEHAHETSVIHRDIKPSNILLTPDGRPKVTDFGLAKVEDALALSRTGDFAGTPYYMSPEQAMSRRIGIDKRTDIYSLGATLYEMLTLNRPFEGKTSHEVLKKIILMEPENPLKANPRVPRDLSVICLKAMEKVPERRYQTMEEFSDDLKRFVSGDVIRARPASVGTRVWKRVKRNPVISAAVSVATASVVVMAVVVPWIIATKNKERYDEAQKLTAVITQERDRADELRSAAVKRVDEILRLSDLRDIEELYVSASKLWPAFPDKIDEYEAWLAEADRLLNRLDSHRKKLDDLRKEALPLQEAAGERDRESHPKWELLLEKRGERENLAERIADREMENERGGRASDRGLEALNSPIAVLDEEIRELEQKVSERRTWEFEDHGTKWWHDMLARLVSDLESMAGDAPYQKKDIERRLVFARSVRQRSIDDHRESWDRAIESIADEDECPKYGGLIIGEQLGFVPLGRDPYSGLWEFSHLQTGEIPRRDSNDKLVLTENTGLVFVLIPGGMFRMGSNLPTEKQPIGFPNVDPMSERYERPVHTVFIEAFFISKYEMTQGQWFQFRKVNPSMYKATDTRPEFSLSWNNPVEFVSWEDCCPRLAQFGLRLPTEAEWEFACRAGTTTVYSTGDAKESLQGTANLLDAAYKQFDNRSWREYEDWLDDGFILHAPVGSFRPNAYGLHDMHGNVYEWCQDVFIESYEGALPDGSARKKYQTLEYVVRGGSYMVQAIRCRCAHRAHDRLNTRDSEIGVRPAYTLK